MLLQEEKPRPQEIQNELFKVEQYVEMVLGYLRTEDMASDIRFEEVDMDSLIREQIHKFARIFIGKKLSLEYQEVSETVLTDEKNSRMGYSPFRRGAPPERETKHE